MKVKLKEWQKRWRYDSFFIKRGDVKECPKEIFEVSGGRLEIVDEPVKKKSYKRKKKVEDEPIVDIAVVDEKLVEEIKSVEPEILD
jgi:hypothetical protein